MIEIKVIHEIHDVRQQQQADLLTQLLPFMEKIVSQLSDLQGLGADIKADLELIKGRLTDQASSISDLHAQLQQLQETTPPQVDLSNAIALASEIKGEADAIVASFGPQEPPADESAGLGGSVDAGAESSGSSDEGSSTGGDVTGSAGDNTGTDSADIGSADAGSTSSGDVIGVAGEPGPDQNGPDAGAGDQAGLDAQPE